jgi:hypothetical protein
MGHIHTRISREAIGVGGVIFARISQPGRQCFEPLPAGGSVKVNGKKGVAEGIYTALTEIKADFFAKKDVH